MLPINIVLFYFLKSIADNIDFRGLLLINSNCPQKRPFLSKKSTVLEKLFTFKHYNKIKGPPSS
jgi:hypothetical protein